MIKRALEEIISKYFFQGRAIIIYGARRVGKTTLLQMLSDSLADKALWFYGDTTAASALLKPKSKEYLANVLGTSRIVVIDEAQLVENIDLVSKLIVDFFPDKQLVLSGSSSFELANKTTEPLTGRKWTFKLFPLSFEELARYTSLPEEINMLEQRLVFGTYPEVVVNQGKAKEVLREIHSSHLYKDVLHFGNVRKSDKLMRLVQALAYQVGQEVKYRELASVVGVDTVTVERYIDILEQSFVIFRLLPFSRNLRDELKNSRKIYFWDNGIRNAVIDDFRPFDVRTDRGALWENYLVSQLVINRYYKQRDSKFYFWRTHQQQEIDLIELAEDGQIYAYEIKLNPKRAKVRFPRRFVETYKPAKTQVLHRENFFEHLY